MIAYRLEDPKPYASNHFNRNREALHADGLKTVKLAVIDVTKIATIEATKTAIEHAEGKLDILVNNAGISKMGVNQNATSIDLETIRDAMETNFYGSIQTTIIILPLIRKSSNGVILNVSTDMASNTFQARPEAQLHFVAYNTSKAAMNSYLIALAHELKNEGIKVNAVTPGFTTTKLNHHAPGGKTTKEGAESLVPWTLLDKNGPTGKFFDWDGKEFPW
jgi:NAD(P)-dependent dehydrogenase (short-subunit alcohol dehydrogenase family)